MRRRPEYYANRKPTLYDVFRLYAEHVEIIVQDKHGKIVECFTVKEAKTFPNHPLFDEIVVERMHDNFTHRVILKLDYAE
jgi:hypothetical protein